MRLFNTLLFPECALSSIALTLTAAEKARFNMTLLNARLLSRSEHSNSPPESCFFGLLHATVDSREVVPDDNQVA